MRTDRKRLAQLLPHQRLGPGQQLPQRILQHIGTETDRDLLHPPNAEIDCA